MKLLTILTITFCTALLSCGEQTKKGKTTETLTTKSVNVNVDQDVINMTDTGTIVTNIELPMVDEPDVDITELVNGSLLTHIKNLHPDFWKNGEPDDIQIEHYFFKPNPNVGNFIMVQVDLVRGEVKTTKFGYFYPTQHGELVPENYILGVQEDGLCAICDLVKVMSYLDKDPIAIFKDRVTGEKTKKFMDYNLAEMSFYWMDKPYTVD